MPFRKKPFTQKQHMLLLRLSMFGVAIFAFIFSLFWNQTEAIMLWFQLTGAIYLGGAGAVIIGGLYWKKGTTEAAFSAMITGSILAVAGIVTKQCNPHFFLNGMQIGFLTAIISCLVYIAVSLLGPRKDYNLDKLLHRGDYVTSSDVVVASPIKKSIWYKLGLTNEFTLKDKFIFFCSLGLAFFKFFLVIAGTVYYVFWGIESKSWTKLWFFYIWIIFALIIGIAVWVSIGGIMDIRMLFKRLKTLKKDEHDDGWVDDQTPDPDFPGKSVP